MSNEICDQSVAVYCGSSDGTQKAYTNAARSLGEALALNIRPLVYGGGSKGIMGVVSKTVFDNGGHVTGVVPYAMVMGGGEGAKTVGPPKGSKGPEESKGLTVEDLAKHERRQTIVVQSMHERKVTMAERVGGFVGLPGGYGTFEEVMEVVTWTQLRIHSKPVTVVNVLGFFEPLRQLIRNGIRDGFIAPRNENLLIFVDGPEDHSLHENFDWGSATLNALDNWNAGDWSGYGFDWKKQLDGSEKSSLSTT